LADIFKFSKPVLHCFPAKFAQAGFFEKWIIMKPVAENLYVFSNLIMGRVYLVRDPNGLTLIDAGLELATLPVLKQLARVGFQAKDVRRILITHAHPDHVGGLPGLKAATGAQVIASTLERPVIEGEIPVPRVPLEKLSGPLRLRPPETIFKPTAVDLEVQGGETLPVMGGLQVIAVPGHAPGHIAFWQPERRILFCGDVLFNFPGLRLPLAMLTVDMQENICSIQKLAALNASIVCFGHGNPLVENTARRIASFAAGLVSAPA
jgi:glyoxylase-like metal-dependent hydrolase (beta-lactamase superfamily II)